MTTAWKPRNFAQRLRHAASEGDVGAMRAELAARRAKVSRAELGEAAITAFRREQAVAGMFLLDLGAKEPKESESFLSAAATGGLLEVVEHLLRSKPEQARWIDDALLAAAREGKLAVARFLLEKGAKLDGVPEEDEEDENEYTTWSPLVAAASGGHFELVEMLLDRGARRGLFHAASDAMTSRSDTPTLRRLLDLLAPTLPAGGLDRMLEGAWRIQSMPAVRLLVQRGARFPALERSGPYSAEHRYGADLRRYLEESRGAEPDPTP